MILPKALSALTSKLSDLKILVVGDLILDRYFWGTVERISPEAPVPVFDLKDITYSLGGSANVASNLRGLGVNVSLMGVVGKDEKGKTLIEMAQSRGIDTKGIVLDPDRPTIIKTRIIAQSQQLLRIDKEEKKPLSPQIRSMLQEVYEDLLSEVHGIILSDYAKGVFLHEGFCSWLVQEARRNNKFLMIDPKSSDWRKYQGATTITPNAKEFREVMKTEGLRESDFDEVAKYLIEKYSLDFLVVTLGKEGIYYYHPSQGGHHFPSQAKEVYDVSGAGDTVIASLSAFYGIGLSLEEAVQLANLCAGIVVGKIGTQPIYLEELMTHLKLISEEEKHG